MSTHQSIRSVYGVALNAKAGTKPADELVVAGHRDAKSTLGHACVGTKRLNAEEKIGCNAHVGSNRAFMPHAARGFFSHDPKVGVGYDCPMKMTPTQARFRQVMDETGLNMRSWALKAGLPETRVKAVMQGKSQNPRADTIAALARAAGVPVRRLVGGEDVGNVKPEISGEMKKKAEHALVLAIWDAMDENVKGAAIEAFRAILHATGKKI